MAALALYGLVADDEMGAEVYFVATKKDQAKVGFNATKKMLSYLQQDSPIARAEFNYNSHTIYSEKYNSFCRAMGRDSKSEDGPSPHFVIVDEYHAHIDDQMVNVMESGMGGRQQPLTLTITTAGYNVFGPCKLFDDNIAKPILTGGLDDPTTFAIIYEAETPEHEKSTTAALVATEAEKNTIWWDDETQLQYANPGISNGTPDLDYLRDRMRKAVNEGGEKETDFLTKNLNVFTRAKKVWIQSKYYKQNVEPVSFKKMKGKTAYLAFDLAKVRDITALSVYLPQQPGLELPRLYQFYWVPIENARERQKKDKVPYLNWIKGGQIRATEGDSVDHDVFMRDVLEICENLKVKGIAYDPWNAETVQQYFKKQGYKTFEFRQYTTLFNEPLTHYELAIIRGEIRYNFNPVTAWMLGNVTVYRDKNENRKIDRDKSQEKVDGIVTDIMAIGLYLKLTQAKKKFKRQGLLMINNESEKSGS